MSCLLSSALPRRSLSDLSCEFSGATSSAPTAALPPPPPPPLLLPLQRPWLPPPLASHATRRIGSPPLLGLRLLPLVPLLDVLPRLTVDALGVAAASHGSPWHALLTRAQASGETIVSLRFASALASAACRIGSPAIRNSHRSLWPTRKPEVFPAPTPKCLRGRKARRVRVKEKGGGPRRQSQGQGEGGVG